MSSILPKAWTFYKRRWANFKFVLLHLKECNVLCNVFKTSCSFVPYNFYHNNHKTPINAAVFFKFILSIRWRLLFE